MSGRMTPAGWGECPYKPAVHVVQADFEIDNIRIDMTSKYAFIYESVLGLITDQIASQFNELIGVAIVEQLDYFINLGIVDGLDTLAN